MKRAIWLGMAVFVAACAGLGPVVPSPPLPTPVIPTEAELPDLGSVLLAVGISGPFSSLADRTMTVPARLAVWDDGRVVAAVSHPSDPAAYKSIVFTPGELDELRRLLLDARLETYYDVNVAGSASCSDCNVTIVQTDVSGHVVEFAGRGFPIEGRQPGQTNELPYPAGMVTAMKAISVIEDRAGTGGTSWTGDMPTIAITPIEVGG